MFCNFSFENTCQWEYCNTSWKGFHYWKERTNFSQSLFTLLSYQQFILFTETKKGHDLFFFSFRFKNLISGIITLIPQKNKNRLFLKNWRPFSLIFFFSEQNQNMKWNQIFKRKWKLNKNKLRPFSVSVTTCFYTLWSLRMVTSVTTS